MTAAADRLAFTRAVLARPDDDLPRLIFADWLDERGESERAEFIRVQVELARLKPTVPEDFTATDEAMAAQERCWRLEFQQWHDLAQIADDGWFAPLDYTWGDGKRSSPALDLADGHNDVHFLVRRGFVDEITCRTEWFLAHAAEIFRAQPVTRVVLSNLEPDRTYHNDTGAECWAWWKPGEGTDQSELPAELWEIMVPRDPAKSRRPRVIPWDRITVDDYPTREEAIGRLSEVCVAYGRQQAARPEPAQYRGPCVRCGERPRLIASDGTPLMTCHICTDWVVTPA